MLRTLTHELRTPATSLRLDIEPLRAAYDDLPAACQAPLLRISDGIERLDRVLYRSVRFMTFFGPNAPTDGLVARRLLPSAKAFFEELEGEWPEGASLVSSFSDDALFTDPEWLGLAIRNLVENGARHGAPPIAVSWALEATALVVRVSDAGGATPPSLAVAASAALLSRRKGAPASASGSPSWSASRGSSGGVACAPFGVADDDSEL